MLKQLQLIAMVLALFFTIGSVYAAPAMRMASEAVYEPLDPKKKKPGEECKSSDECQRHHACKKIAEKSVCTAPPRPKLPYGAVT
jgi:hypothetical protein